MAQAGSLTLTSNDIHEVTTEKQHTLGAIAQTKDGRLYRYAKNGTSALDAGAEVVASSTSDYSSTASEDIKRSATMVHTAGTVSASNAPKYEDGILVVDGSRYLANGVSRDGTVSLVDRIDTPISESDSVALEANQFCGVGALGETGDAIGEAEVAVPANAYFWAFISL